MTSVLLPHLSPLQPGEERKTRILTQPVGPGTGEEPIPFWVVSIFILVGFFILAACLRPVIGEGFEWTCWRPSRFRDKGWDDGPDELDDGNDDDQK